MTNHGITYRGYDLEQLFDLKCTVMSDPLLPAQDDRMIFIPGRVDPIRYPDKRWHARTIRVQCDMIRPMDYEEIRQLAFILSDKGELVLGYEPDKYYMAEVYEAPSKEQLYNIGFTFDIVFACDPFAYGKTISETHAEHPIRLAAYKGTAETPLIATLTTGSPAPTQVVVSGYKRVVFGRVPDDEVIDGDDRLSYTGTFTQREVVVNGVTRPLLTLTGSGTLSIGVDTYADVWMCGCGADGGAGQPGVKAGDGGAGAYCAQSLNMKLVTGPVNVPTQYSDGAATYNGLSASSATGKNGGTGGGAGALGNASTVNTGGTGDGVSKVPFGQPGIFAPHCGGGGGGGYRGETVYGGTGGAGGSNGSVGGNSTRALTYNYGERGDTSAGRGGVGHNGSPDGGDSSGNIANSGHAATAPGGGGGGGGSGTNATGASSGGAGYQGVVYLLLV